MNPCDRCGATGVAIENRQTFLYCADRTACDARMKAPKDIDIEAAREALSHLYNSAHGDEDNLRRARFALDDALDALETTPPSGDGSKQVPKDSK